MLCDTTCARKSLSSASLVASTAAVKPPTEVPPEVNLVADRFADPDQSGLTLEVPGGDFALEVSAP